MHQNAPTIVNSACKMQSPPSTANAEGEKNQKAIVKCSVKGLATDVNPLRFALAYAAAGFPVFPCRDGGDRAKAPYTGSGFKEATTDPEQIKQWWAKWPHALIGVPMGAASGLWCLDIDRPKKQGDIDGLDSLQALLDKHGALPNTASQTSASSGKHYFFKYDQKCKFSNRAGTIAPKIDIRAQGGYIIIAPSVIPNVGKYTAGKPIQEYISDLKNAAEAPAWLVELAQGSPQSYKKNSACK